MQVLSGFDNNGCHFLDTAGAYEWWYLDANDASGEWGAVVILFRGMPMSPDYLRAQSKAGKLGTMPIEHCGYSVSVYHKRKRVAMAFRGVPAEHTTFNRRNGVTVGLASLLWSETTVLCSVNTVDPQLEQSVILDINLRNVDALASSDAPFSDQHGWVLAAPRLVGTMSVELREGRSVMAKATIDVTAYHDHNMGRRSMQTDFSEWLWGRVHADDETTVYLSTEGISAVYSIGASGINPWSDVEIEVSGRRPTVMGLRAPRTVNVRGTLQGEAREVVVQQQRVLDDGPFYQRYASLFVLEAGKQHNWGYSEYMDVSRFASAWIRPFLRLPWIP